MRRNRLKKPWPAVLSALAVLAATAAAEGAGFAVDTHGARSTGMADAVTAHIDNPSAAFYNPAGLVEIHKIDLMAGVTLILPDLHFTDTKGESTSTNFKISPPPHVYGGVKLTDNLALGLGVFAHYGSAASWPEDWDYRFRALRSQLSTFYFNPEVAYKLFGRVRVGAGVQIVRGSVDIERKLNFVDSEGTTELSGGGWGAGFNAGVQVDVLPKTLSLGLSYRSFVVLDLSGEAHFKDIPKELSHTLKDQPITSKMRTPDTVLMGAAYRPKDNLLLAVDVHWYNWSNVEAITIEFDDPALTQSLPKRWHGTVNFHVGAEYKATEALAVRAGFVYDPSPSPEDTLTMDLPDSNRIKGALGVGYALRHFQFDLGYQFVGVLPGTSTAPGYEGSYGGTAHVIGLSAGFHKD